MVVSLIADPGAITLNPYGPILLLGLIMKYFLLYSLLSTDLRRIGWCPLLVSEVCARSTANRL